jgi:transcriptional regulator with XRE-family HTH domain
MLLLERPVTPVAGPEPDELTREQLIALRQLTRWSQARFGEVVGYSQSAIDLMEAGRRSIPRELQRTARALVEQELRREIAHRQTVIRSISTI